MSSPLTELAMLLSSLSVMAFGGGNVIIPELQQEVVVVHGWLTSREFLDVFSISRAVPGPSMIMVLPIGYKVAGFSGAAVAVLCMFVPACLIMFGGSSIVDRLQGNPWMQTTLRALAPVTMGLILASAFILGKTAATGWLTIMILVGSLILLVYTRINIIILIIVSGILGFIFLQGP